MGQQEILDFLARNPRRWFNVRAIKVFCSKNQVSLQKLRKSGMIDSRKERLPIRMAASSLHWSKTPSYCSRRVCWVYRHKNG